MKAWRNVGGTVVEIQIDIDLKGEPILPPDTTINPRPEANEGHYVTVVGNAWVQIPIPVVVYSFETKKQNALKRLKVYRDWYIDQPATYQNVKFDSDETARNRLTQALVLYQNNNYLPPAWIAYDNSVFPITSIADLSGIIAAVQNSFTAKFFEMTTLRGQVDAATNEEQLNAIDIPSIPKHF